jgi:uncharacterized protein
VSGVGWGGPPGAALDAALAGHFEIVTSPALLDELRRVLGYPKLQAVTGDANELIKFLALAAVVVTPTETVTISRDPDDDRLIEAALAAHAIVTGDQDLLTLGHIGQIQILTPREGGAARNRGPECVAEAFCIAPRAIHRCAARRAAVRDATWCYDRAGRTIPQYWTESFPRRSVKATSNPNRCQ